MFRFATIMTVALLGVAVSPLTAIAQEPRPESAEKAAQGETLQGMLPNQSTAMMSVDYNFANLWFAGQAQNWPLAAYYLGETKGAIAWTVRLQPVRKTSHGDLELRPILDAMREGPFADVTTAIAAKDKPAFEDAYKHVMTACYSCHVAAEKPYLRLHIPEAPATRMIDIPSAAQ
jgi:hypothetical protein